MGICPFRIQQMIMGNYKNRILLQGQGGFPFKPTGVLKYAEDLKWKANTEIEAKDIFYADS